MQADEAEVTGRAEQAAVIAGLVVFLGITLGGRQNDLLPSSERLVIVFAAMAVLILVGVPRLRAHGPLITVLFLVAAGLLLRWVSVSHPGGSDVLPVTNEAIKTVLGGGNPYDHYYTSSRPPGAPFPYPPVNLILHLPGYLLGGLTGVRMTELALGWVVLVLLARIALMDVNPLSVVMLALYAGLPNLINLIGDGSNDTSSGAVLVLFMLGLARADSDGRRGAILAGVLAAAALGTKQSALPVVLAGSVWLFWVNRPQFRRYAAAGAATLVAVSVPFMILAGPVGYVRALASFAGFHEDVYGWNIWVLAQQMGWPMLSREDAQVLGLVIGLVALAVVALLRYRSLRTAMLSGAVAMAVLFLAQRWTSYAYFAQLMSVLVVVPLLDYAGLSRKEDRLERHEPAGDRPVGVGADDE